MSICLVMMVKDEETNLPRCIEAALPLIDSWCILDTGSTDTTKELISELLGGLPGQLHLDTFEGFGRSRTKLMHHARDKADYLLLLDADMVIHCEQLPPPGGDVYMGRILGSLDYALPIFVRGNKKWCYEGVAHSYLACDGGYDEAMLPGLTIEDHSHTTVEKLQRDLLLLSSEHSRKPTDARTAFYLARTYDDLDMFDEAIQFYRIRANLPGWDEETFYARYRLGCLLCEHRSFLEGSKELIAAWEYRPSRIESLRALANVANSVADKATYPDDKLFVRRSAYS